MFFALWLLTKIAANVTTQNKSVPIVAIVKQSKHKLRLFWFRINFFIAWRYNNDISKNYSPIMTWQP